MKLKLTRRWRGRDEGDVVEGKDAVKALNDKAATPPTGTKPAERAEKRPGPSAEKR